MATFFILYVVIGGGIGSHSWGGPAMLRFDTHAECSAAAEAMRGRKWIVDVDCVRVTFPVR